MALKSLIHIRVLLLGPMVNLVHTEENILNTNGKEMVKATNKAQMLVGVLA